MSGFNLGRANTPGLAPGARGRPATVLAGASGDPELAVSVSNRTGVPLKTPFGPKSPCPATTSA
jgi:hypothetical protein